MSSERLNQYANISLPLIAEDLFNQSAPIRNQLFNRSAAFLGVAPNNVSSPSYGSPFGLFKSGRGRGKYGGLASRITQNISGVNPVVEQQPTTPTLDPTQSILFSPGKQAIEDQFANAKESLIASGATGGALADQLLELELNKAKQISDFQGGLAEDELNRAFALGTGILPQVNSGLTSSAAAQAQANAARSQGKGDKGRAVGYVAGTMLTGGNHAGGKAGASVGGKAGG